MDQFTGYLYSAMWLIIAIYLAYQAFKQSKFLLVLSAFFLFLTGWYLTDTILPDPDLFSGIYGTIFRSVAAVVLLVCIIVYIIYKKSKIIENKDDN